MYKWPGRIIMESQMANAIHPKYQPVALIWSNEKPAGAMQFQENKRGCVMWLAARAAKGKVAVADAKTFGCFGGGASLYPQATGRQSHDLRHAPGACGRNGAKCTRLISGAPYMAKTDCCIMNFC